MLKINKLTAALKTKSIVRWIKTDSHSYIMTDFFILKTNQEITGSALTALLKMLGGIPQVGHGLECKYDVRSEISEDSIKRTIDLIDIPDRHKTISFTNLLLQTDKHLMSIFKAEDYIYLNKTYVDLINLYEKDIKILGNNRLDPVYFTSENEILMVLPLKIPETPSYLKEEA